MGGVLALERRAALGRCVGVARRRVGAGKVPGHVALLGLLAGVAAIVVFAAAAPSLLVSRGGVPFPAWLSGPLHGPFGRITEDRQTLEFGLSAVLVAMAVAYAAALLWSRALSMRAVVVFVAVVHAILLLSPPLESSDLFTYLAYARLGVLHHLNPYTHAIAREPHDPAFFLSSWHHWHSPYGQLFTAVSYPLAWLPVPVAYWALKTVTVLTSLAVLAVLARCACALGRDTRFAVLLVAANPLYLVYALGGFHNDFFMLALSAAAIALVLSGRDRAAGVALVAAIGVKFTVVLLLPFLLLGADTGPRRRRMLSGAGLAAVLLVAASVALFGLTLPNVSGQSDLITGLSMPNLLGLAIGAGGAVPTVVHALDVAVVLVAIHQLLRNRDWLAGAAWSTLVLVASIAWLMPWYVIWAFPLVALSGSRKLCATALALAAFVLITVLPTTGMFLSAHHLDPLGGRAIRGVIVQENRLQRP